MGNIKNSQIFEKDEDINEYEFKITEAQLKKLNALNTSILTIYNLGRGLLSEYLRIMAGEEYPFKDSKDELTFEISPENMTVKVSKLDK